MLQAYRSQVMSFAIGPLSVLCVTLVYYGQTVGWIKNQNATWYGGRPQSRPHCVRGGPSSPMERSTATPTFRAMSIVA